MQPEQGGLTHWSGVAPLWEKHREVIRQMFAPVTEALAEEGRVGSGNAVLDIATGPGEPALSLVARVGLAGRVVGIDPVPGMVAAARRAAERMGFGNVEFDVAFADQLPFTAETFDAVVSRFGAMFFASPVDAVREMLRVLKPGGRLALAVWGLGDRNPFFHTMQRVFDRYGDSPPPQAGASDAFRFASPGVLREVMAEAGALEPAERVLAFHIQASLPVEDFYTLRCEMSEKLREKAATLSAEQLADVRRESLEALRGYATGHGMSLPAEVVIVSGTKGRQG